jgi:FkbM family methyltransferase
MAKMPGGIRRLVPHGLPFRIKLFGERWMAKSRFEIRRRLPVITLDPLDLVLDTFASRDKSVTIMQVGACDGIMRDPVSLQVAKDSTRAILIEPNPYAFARLQDLHADRPNVTLIQAAIGEKDGEAHLYRVRKTEKEDSAVDLTLGIASFYKEHLERHGKKDNEIERITVPCRSLSSLVAELGLTKIDLLQIDAEGFDAAVVRMALKLPVRPDCINFEHVHLAAQDRQPLFDLLQENGYLLGYDAWNILARQKTSLEIPTDVSAGSLSARRDALESDLSKK